MLLVQSATIAQAMYVWGLQNVYLVWETAVCSLPTSLPQIPTNGVSEQAGQVWHVCQRKLAVFAKEACLYATNGNRNKQFERLPQTSYQLSNPNA